ncbi:hypothetical protein WK24_10860 [Burkholderia vietnamiensis]|nr:hypothetical protein WK24_10860 [Burkholderia vietnamiensis]
MRAGLPQFVPLPNLAGLIAIWEIKGYQQRGIFHGFEPMGFLSQQKQHISAAHQPRFHVGAEFDGALEALHRYFSGRPMLGDPLARQKHKSNDLKVVRAHERDGF